MEHVVPPPIEERFFTVGEVAAMLRVSPETVYRWIKGRPKQNIPPTMRAEQIGRQWRIPESAVHEFRERGHAAGQ
jgi:excisionase family DNA binding protein